ncbi:MAG: hypothetical protein J6J42_05430 [Lachnospiraceae bacterium]|nr:hypothetical protein [Lachnospiraceae bacterium]MBP3609761.1 hypothetical protein [Lachnospiraceae bacterium]
MRNTFSLYYCFLFLGLLLIVLTIRSLSEKQSLILPAVQLLLSAALAIAAGHPFVCLAAYECRIGRKHLPSLFLPSLLYGIIQAATREHPFPQVLFSMLLLFFLSLLMRGVEYLLKNYLSARNQIARAVSITAVNELYEKKLNQELVMKHYLAEKNARLEERENISRNIHNSVGHSITAAIMALDAADLLFDASPDKAREKMNLAAERIRGSLASIRHAVRVLDNEAPLVSISDFTEQLLAVTDHFLMDTTRQVLTDFSNVYPGLELPHEHAEFLTGALEELLSNGVRHGNADRFTVRLTADSSHIKLTVLDNGSSDFSEENSQERIQHGFGLKKLSSYATRCGGTALFTGQQGFQADITLPIAVTASDSVS